MPRCGIVEKLDGWWWLDGRREVDHSEEYMRGVKWVQFVKGWTNACLLTCFDHCESFFLDDLLKTDFCGLT